MVLSGPASDNAKKGIRRQCAHLHLGTLDEEIADRVMQRWFTKTLQFADKIDVKSHLLETSKVSAEGKVALVNHVCKNLPGLACEEWTATMEAFFSEEDSDDDSFTISFDPITLTVRWLRVAGRAHVDKAGAMANFFGGVALQVGSHTKWIASGEIQLHPPADATIVMENLAEVRREIETFDDTRKVASMVLRLPDVSPADDNNLPLVDSEKKVKVKYLTLPVLASKRFRKLRRQSSMGAKAKAQVMPQDWFGTAFSTAAHGTLDGVHSTRACIWIEVIEKEVVVNIYTNDFHSGNKAVGGGINEFGDAGATTDSNDSVESCSQFKYPLEYKHHVLELVTAAVHIIAELKNESLAVNHQLLKSVFDADVVESESVEDAPSSNAAAGAMPAILHLDLSACDSHEASPKSSDAASSTPSTATSSNTPSPNASEIPPLSLGAAMTLAGDQLTYHTARETNSAVEQAPFQRSVRFI